MQVYIKKFLAMLTLAAVNTVGAQSLLVVTTSAPGGVPDTLARQLIQHYDKIYNDSGSTVIFNRPAADGLVGIRQFLTESANRDAVLFPATGHVVNLDDTDFGQLEPLIEIVKQPMTLAVRSDFPAATWSEFVEYCKLNPGKVTVAITSRALSMPGAMRIEKNHSIALNYIVYGQNSSFYTDLYAGVVDAAWVPASAYFGGPMQQRSRALLVTAPKNSANIPNQLLLANDKKIGPWYLSQGIFVNRSMSSDKKQTLRRRFATIIQQHWAKDFLPKNPGVMIGSSDHEEFETLLIDYRKDWSQIKHSVK